MSCWVGSLGDVLELVSCFGFGVSRAALGGIWKSRMGSVPPRRCWLLVDSVDWAGWAVERVFSRSRSLGEFKFSGRRLLGTVLYSTMCGVWFLCLVFLALYGFRGAEGCLESAGAEQDNEL